MGIKVYCRLHEYDFRPGSELLKFTVKYELQKNSFLLIIGKVTFRFKFVFCISKLIDLHSFKIYFVKVVQIKIL
jgi:hypothetical protein